MPIARVALYVATASALALGVKSWLSGPPPTWVAAVAFVAYLTLILVGVLVSGLSMFADVITVGPAQARGIALTFDDGPDPVNTREVLDILASANAVATFFVIGKKVDRHPEVLEEIVAAGHAVGVHSYEHDRLFSLRSPKRIRADLVRCIAAIEKVTGERPTLFRAPIGHISPSMAREVDRLDLAVIGWSARGLDGLKRTTADAAFERVRPRLVDGCIVLLHDAAERDDFKPVSIAALPRILKYAQDKQLPFVRVDRWLGIGSEAELEAVVDEA